MAISRGGLQYTIQVDGNFAAQFELFRAELAAAKTAWEAFRAQVAAAGRGTGSTASGTKDLADSTEKEKDEVIQAAEAEEQYTRNLSKRKTVTSQLNNEANRNAATLERERLIAERRSELDKQSLIQDRARIAAIRALNNALKKQAEQEEKNALAVQRGFKNFAEMEAALTAEAIAADRAAAAEKKLAVARLLAAQGLDATGKPVNQQGVPLGPLTQQQQQQEAANKAQVQFQRELEALQQRVLVDQIRQGSTEYQDLQKQLQGAAQETKRVADETDSLESRVNRVSFTFRRLFGILAAFTVARLGIQGFVGSLKAAVDASAQLEKTKFGLAGLISSVSDVRNAQGQILQGQEKFNAAQEIAIGLQQRLRTASLGTSASFQEVVDAFQQAFGPGQQAGLNLKETERAVILVSSAFDVLGLQAGQLQEEIRAALTGIGKVGQSRIFQLVPQASIQNAIRANKLLPLLEERLGGVAKGAEAVSRSFTGLASNLVDAAKLLLASSGKNFYNNIKTLLYTARRQIVQTVEGTVVETPQALKAFSALFDGIAFGVKAVTDALKNLDFKALEALFGTVGNSIGIAVTAFSSITSALVNGARPILELGRTLTGSVLLLVEGLKRLDTFTGGWLKSILQALASLASSYLVLRGVEGVLNLLFGKTSLIRLAFTAMVGSWKLIRGLMFGAIEALTKMVTLSKATTRNMLLVLGVIGAVTIALEKLNVLEKAIEGIDALVGPAFARANALADKFLSPEKVAQDVKTSVYEVTQSIASLTRAAGEGIQELRDRIIEIGLTAAAQKLTFGVDSGAADAAQIIQQNLINAAKQSLELEKQRQLVISKLTLLKEQQAGVEEKLKVSVDETNKELSARQNIDKQISDLANQVLEQQKQNAQVDAKLAKSEGVRGQERLKLLVEQQKGQEKLVELQGSLRALQADGRGQVEALTAAQDKQAKLVQEQASGVAQIKSLEEGRLALENSMADLRNRNLEVAAKELAILQARRAIEIGIERRQLELQTTQAQRRAPAEATGNQRTLTALSAVEDVENAILALQLKQQQVGRNNAYWDEQRKILSEAALNDTESLAQIEKLVNKEKALGVAQTKQEVAQLNLAIAKLREVQNQQSDNFGGGLLRGIRNFAQDQNLFQGGQKFAEGALQSIGSSISSIAADGIAAGFDPNRNFQLRPAIGNLLATLGGQLVETVVNKGIGLLIEQVAPTLFENTGTIAGASALTTAAAAIDTSAAAVAAAATPLSTGAGALGTASLALDTSGTALTLAAARWAPVADTLLAAAALLAGSSIAGGAAYGGPAEATLGFAVGGRTPSRHSMPRPRRGLDPRDRIPAWLRFGEWVIRPEAVRTYGHDVMDKINRMQVPADALRSVAGAARSGPPSVSAPSGPGFASGGAVSGALAAATGSTPQMPPVIVTDDQFADQVLSGGRKALHRATRRDRSEVRLSLGI